MNGNDKTALKFTLAKYLESQGVGIAQIVNPMLAPELTTDTRAWKDLNGNFVPDCDFANPAPNGECGPSGNVNFGKGTPAIRYAPNTVTGWGTRGYNWETAAGIQQALRPGLSVDASYHRRQNGNFRVTDNLLTTPADDDPYCIAVPVDSRLPGGRRPAAVRTVRPHSDEVWPRVSWYPWATSSALAGIGKRRGDADASR